MSIKSNKGLVDWVSVLGYTVTQCPIISSSLCVENKQIDWDTFTLPLFVESSYARTELEV